MWVEKITKGKKCEYKFCERFRNPLTGKVSRLSVTLTSKNRAAQKEARLTLESRWQTMLANGGKKAVCQQDAVQTSAPSVMTIQQVAREWQQYHAPTVRESTAYTIQQQLNSVMTVIDGSTPIAAFTPVVLENALRKMYLVQGGARSTCQKRLTVIRQIIRYARKARYIPADQADDLLSVKMPRRPLCEDDMTRQHEKLLDADELAETLRQVKEISPRVSLLCEFLSMTGLRVGEAVALRVQDYDKKLHVVHVTGSINYAGKRTPPKNRYSVRDVVLNNRCVAILNQIVMENKTSARWSKKYRDQGDQGFLFTSVHGNPISKATIDGALARVVLPSGKHVSSHWFRHTHISNLAAAGVPTKAIMARVGHHSAATTLQVYEHATLEMKRQVMKAIESM